MSLREAGVQLRRLEQLHSQVKDSLSDMLREAGLDLSEIRGVGDGEWDLRVRILDGPSNLEDVSSRLYPEVDVLSNNDRREESAPVAVERFPDPSEDDFPELPAPQPRVKTPSPSFDRGPDLGLPFLVDEKESRKAAIAEPEPEVSVPAPIARSAEPEGKEKASLPDFTRDAVPVRMRPSGTDTMMSMIARGDQRLRVRAVGSDTSGGFGLPLLEPDMRMHLLAFTLVGDVFMDVREKHIELESESTIRQMRAADTAFNAEVERLKLSPRPEVFLKALEQQATPSFMALYSSSR
jgi:hypothetical protein